MLKILLMSLSLIGIVVCIVLLSSSSTAKIGLLACVAILILLAITEFVPRPRKQPTPQQVTDSVEALEDYTMRVRSRAEAKIERDK